MQTRLSLAPVHSRAALVLILVSTLVPMASLAQDDDDVEEIVILGAESDAAADFAAGDSVTGFGAEDLAALGAQSIADLASFTPNLEIVTSGATTPTFFIRGVGLNDFNPNSTGAVAVYQDDVAINAPAIQLGTLFDVEGVNVLRGPQGTGIARNASAGAIKIYGRKPTGDFGGYLRADFGNYGFQDYEGAVEAPIFEDYLSGRFAFRLTKRDGTMKNNCGSAAAFLDRTARPSNASLPGVIAPWSICGEPVETDSISTVVPPGLPDHVNDQDNWAARGTLLFQPTLDTTFYLNAHGARRDELSRLGQAIGTGGTFCTDPNKICKPPFGGVPVGLRDRSVRSEGLLGGGQGTAGANFSNAYIPREIRKRMAELAPCEAALDSSERCNTKSVQERIAANHGLIKLSDELQNLDEEPWEGDFNFTGPTTNDSVGGYVKSEIALPGALELATTTAVDAYDRLIAVDLDFSPETLFHITTDDEGIQFYQDFMLAGDLGDTGLRWELGAWFLHEELDVVVTNDFGDGAASAVGVRERAFSQDTDSAAGFLAFSFDFLEDFTVDGGYRYNWEEKHFEMTILGLAASGSGDACVTISLQQSACRLNEAWDASTGTIRLLYRFREDTHVSWRYTRGWKPGSVNATASQFSGPTLANPETLNAYEFGLHGSWFDGLVRLDASLFYYDYDDYQIFTARQFLGGNPEFVLLNANDAEVFGSEMDAVVRPWVGAFWQVRFSWLETQFLDFVRRDQFLRPGGPIASRETQASGNRLLNSPQFKVSMTVEQTVPLGRYGSFALRYDGVWTDITYYDASEGVGLGDDDGDFFLPDETIAQPAFWLHNLRATWRAPGGGFEVAGWVRNIENQSYKTFAFDGSNFNNTTIYFVGDPRTYGVSIFLNF